MRDRREHISTRYSTCIIDVFLVPLQYGGSDIRSAIQIRINRVRILFQVCFEECSRS